MPSPFPNRPPWQRGRVDLQLHASRVLQGNPWDDPAERDLYVYLPPGYDRGDARYPAVMLLAGYAGNGEKFFNRGLSDQSIASRIDALIEAGCPPFIAVLPDCMTSLGGSQYVDSPALGAYATYCATEVRAFVDGRYRTSGAWGVVGHSSGGFGALHLAMNHPGAFQAVASHAGDMGFDLCYLEDIPRAVAGVAAAGGLEPFLRGFWELREPDGRAFAALNLLCMACAYAPDLDAAPVPARLPVNFATGEVDFDALRAWSALDPIEQVRDPARAAALRELGLLYLDAGDRDEHHLQLGLRRFVARLRAAEVPFHHEEFRGGHRGLVWRYDSSLPRVVSALAGSTSSSGGASPPSGQTM